MKLSFTFKFVNVRVYVPCTFLCASANEVSDISRRNNWSQVAVKLCSRL